MLKWGGVNLLICKYITNFAPCVFHSIRLRLGYEALRNASCLFIIWGQLLAKTLSKSAPNLKFWVVIFNS